MYPPVIVLVFLGTLFVRRKLHARRVQERVHELKLFGLPWGALLQPYTCFLAIFASLYVYLGFACCQLFGRYSWLDPDTFSLPRLNQTEVDTIHKECELNMWIRLLALLSPLFIGITLVITLAHLWLHLPRNRGFDEHLRWCPTYSHDLAMQVVALPLVYGIFALDNVMALVHLVTGEAYTEALKRGKEPMHTWKEALYNVMQRNDTNFDLADLYEAWALRSFGLLCIMLVSRQIRMEVPTVKFLIDTVRGHLNTVAGADNQGTRVLNDLTILDNPQNLLFEPLRQTSNLGVNVFVYTYALKSAYLLTLQMLTYPPLTIQLCGQRGIFPAACSVIPYVDGACFLASTLAILNIIVFESSFKDILHRECFRPYLKFLAVKVLVSLVFIQFYGLSVIMGQVWKMSQIQVRLSYACLVCCEVLPLSILVLLAWRPRPGDWYGGDCCDGQHGQLADESAWQLGDSFVESRQPSLALAAGRGASDELTAVIELRGNVQAKEGRALEEVINTLSQSVTAQYKPAALYRGIGQRGAYWGPGQEDKEPHEPTTSASGSASFASTAVGCTGGGGCGSQAPPACSSSSSISRPLELRSIGDSVCSTRGQSGGASTALLGGTAIGDARRSGPDREGGVSLSNSTMAVDGTG